MNHIYNFRSYSQKLEWQYRLKLKTVSIAIEGFLSFEEVTNERSRPPVRGNNRNASNMKNVAPSDSILFRTMHYGTKLIDWHNDAKEDWKHTRRLAYLR